MASICLVMNLLQSACSASVRPSDASMMADVSTTLADPQPPRSIAPLSTAGVTQRRPTLRWALAAGTEGAHVQICRDRACATEIARFDASGTSGAPTADLPAGVVFWRAYGRAGSVTGTRPGTTWEFTVGAASAAGPDTSWGSTLDLNGDGFVDVVVGAPYTMQPWGAAYVFLGSAHGVGVAPSIVLPARLTRLLRVASAGDVDGDGFADLLVDETVYLGGVAGPSPERIVTLPGAAMAIGDFNGDGYADLISDDTATGTMRLIAGSEHGPVAAPAGMLNVASDGLPVGGDFDGDGFGDVALVGRGHIDVYRGNAMGIAGTATITVATDLAITHSTAASAGDVDSDGRADLITGESNGVAHYFAGSDLASGTPRDTTLIGSVASGVPGTGFIAAASAGDVNADGFADVILGVPSASEAGPMGTTGGAMLFLGSAAGPIATPAQRIVGQAGNFGAFGISVLGVGDVDGDGFGDVLIGATTTQEQAGFAYVYTGNPTGLGATPATTIVGVEEFSDFGLTVARWMPAYDAAGAPSRASTRWRTPRGARHAPEHAEGV